MWLKWRVMSKIIDSFNEPPLMSVPPDRGGEGEVVFRVFMSADKLNEMF